FTSPSLCRRPSGVSAISASAAARAERSRPSRRARRPGFPPFPETSAIGSSMQHRHLQFGEGFRVVLGNEHGQAAQMTLAPGASEGGPDNRHRGADQWLYVVNGTGKAVVNEETH